jgi:DNA-directed RNA polymerase subunit RPC12/RpoP
MSKWKNADFCVNCDESLTFHMVMYSHGRCPYCGYKGKTAGTVVDVYNKAYRRVKVGSFLKFWKPIFKYEYKE